MGLLIRGGVVVTAEGRRRADVWCVGGKIERVEPDLPMPEGAEVIEAAGRLVLPGLVDPHVHAYLPLVGVQAQSDYPRCTRAALLGGTTCIMDFAGSGLEADVDAAWALWTQQAEGQAACDYLWHMTITRFDEVTRRQLEALVAAGRVGSLKIYLAYKPTLALGDEDLLAVLEFAAAHDLVVMAHCENAELIPARQRQLLAAGKTGPEWHEPSRPSGVEAEGICRFLTFAEATGARAYVVHVSSAEGLEMAERFRGRVRELYLETMIHYLLLDKSYAERADFEGAKWVLSPPLRGRADQDALWSALAEGRVDTLGTDHCPFNFEGQKTLGRGDFSKIPNGIGGVEERVALAYTAGVVGGRLSLERLVAVAAENPAKIFGLWGRKGRVAPGFDADVVVWNPEARGVISAQTHHIGTDYSAYEGVETQGAPEVVTVRGEIVARNGQLVGALDRGKLLHF
ncbi:MAG: dihydropyrimidinase [Lentisphaerae bacterium]|jgi:dihydropyrimidinase|nr:dihydropyrimidinase [Lentisphaerota bacterium]